MKNFRASNGYFVSFICRYRQENDYRLERGGESVRLTISDRDCSAPRVNCGELTTDILQAYNEYAIEENRQYQEWRVKNAHLLTA